MVAVGKLSIPVLFSTTALAAMAQVAGPGGGQGGSFACSLSHSMYISSETVHVTVSA